MHTKDLSSPDSEAALLGALLINPALIQEISIQPDDFYLRPNRRIFAAMIELDANQSAIDPITLSAELTHRGQLIEVGGDARIAELVSFPSFSGNAVHYAARIKEWSDRRKLINLANKIAKAAVDPEQPVSAAQALALESFSDFGAVDNAAVPVRDWIADAVAEIERRRNSPLSEFILPTGFSDIDRVIDGLSPPDGTLLMLSGEWGVGKTILAQDFAMSFQTFSPGAFYSLEMSAFRLSLRMLSVATGLSAKAMKKGKVSDGEMEEIERADHADVRIHTSYARGFDTATLRADLVRLKRDHGITWFVLDYLGLLADKFPGNVPEWEAQGQIGRRLMDICRDLELGAVVIHTQTKSGELAGAAKIGYDGDIHLSLAPDEVTAGIVEVKIKKNRDGEGPLGSVDLFAPKDTPKFESAAGQRIDLSQMEPKPLPATEFDPTAGFDKWWNN